MEESTQKTKSFNSILRDFIKFLFSTFGTVALVALYAVAGGYLFQYLEQANEKDECFQQMNSYSPMENDTIRLMLEIGASFRDNKAQSSRAVAIFLLALANFRDEILFIGYDGSNCSAMGEPDGSPYGWSFAGALSFSCTVITTISMDIKRIISNLLCINLQFGGVW